MTIVQSPTGVAEPPGTTAGLAAEERAVRALERQWSAIKGLLLMSCLIVLAPTGVWVVQGIQNDAGLGTGGTVIEHTAVIHHNGPLADTVTFLALIVIDLALVSFYFWLLDRLGDV